MIIQVRGQTQDTADLQALHVLAQAQTHHKHMVESCSQPCRARPQETLTNDALDSPDSFPKSKTFPRNSNNPHVHEI